MRVTGELIVGGMQEPLDRLYAEHLPEIRLQCSRSGFQCQALVDGQVGMDTIGTSATSSVMWSPLLGGVQHGCDAVDAVGDVVQCAVECLLVGTGGWVGDGPVQATGIDRELLVGVVADGDH